MLPKAHLHVHLEGAMRPSTLQELAADAGIPIPEIRGFGSFSAFAGMYVAACQVVRTPAHLRRLVLEVVEDAAIDGAVWVEPATYVPHHRERLGSDEDVLEIVLDAAAAAAAQFGIGVGVMVAADRTVDPQDAIEQARLAVRYRDRGVVSFGLANDEAIGPPEDFAAAFAIAREDGLLSTPHAGELAGPESVLGALDALGADRVQHGVRAVEDTELVKRLADSPVCLDVCPTSNVLLAVVPRLADHPLPTLLDAGIACSLNADDPLLFGPNLLEEYELVRREFDFDDAQMAFIAQCSIDASGAPPTLKRETAAEITQWLRD
ncbi:MAG: adenosine deaminase [Actinomycetia bacterium]|nr:adenosine deaminase [Actinomycetes bacterium]